VGESDAPEVKQQEPRPLEGLSGMHPGADVRPEEGKLPPLGPPPGVIPDELEAEPGEPGEAGEDRSDADPGR
jgi:hypothetical protein